MTRLQSELHRLYLPLSQAQAQTRAQPLSLIDPSDTVRAMVFELAGPPSWDVLSRVWQGVQAELGLPAPAVAVSGTDGLQLWFSVAEPIAVAQAHAFLESLRSRFLPTIESSRVRLLPSPRASALRPELRARLVPAQQAQSENWSAFVAPGLAAVFADMPWLDIPPSEEGQAALLSGLEAIKRPEFDAALEKLGLSTDSSNPTVAAATHAIEPLMQAPPAPADPSESPKRFLLRVMNDDTVALALRIEAAKALLQHSNDHHRRQAE